MKVKDQLAICRRQLRDTKKPYLWTDEELLDWISEAQLKAARNARLIRDASTPEICRINLVTTKQSYTLDSRVIFVRRVKLDSRSDTLRKISYRDLDAQQAGWIDRTGSPDRWCTDYETGKLWFNRKPTSTDVARLLVVRGPLAEITASTLERELEIPIPYQRGLHHWVLFRAYDKDDSETADPDQAEKNRLLFMNEFGEDSSAIEEEWARQHYGEEDGEGEL